MSVSASLCGSPFWKSHRELCDWLEWRRSALSEAAGLHTQSPCTTTCCSSTNVNEDVIILTPHSVLRWAAAPLPEASPVCRFASCLQDEGSVRLSVWPLVGPDHSAHCSSPRWPKGANQVCQTRSKKGDGNTHKSSTTHVVWDIDDGHEDSASCCHGGQMQPQLQITHRVTAEVLQLKKISQRIMLPLWLRAVKVAVTIFSKISNRISSWFSRTWS